MATLYELSGKYKQLLEYEEDMDPTLFHDTLDSIKDALDDKAINYGHVINQLNGDVDQLKAEEERLNKRRKAIESKVAIMKQTLLEQMQSVGRTKINSIDMTISIRKNAPSVDVIDETKIPDNFFIIKKQLDKKLVKEALKNGEEIKGASLKQTESLSIR